MSSFIIVLVVQFLAGLYAYSRDLMHPFSNAKETAAYIQKLNSDLRYFIACDNESVTSMGAYLRKKLYNLGTRQIHSYHYWNDDLKDRPDFINYLP